MNREIEFRAWLKKEYYSVLNPENKIYRVENLDFDKNEAYLSECGWYDFDDIELMQYTGLKDKNGVKIFEGDIVLAVNFKNHKADYYKHQVVYKEGEFGGWKLVSLEETSYEYQNLFDELICKLEVIGNIYENPELLEV